MAIVNEAGAEVIADPAGVQSLTAADASIVLGGTSADPTIRAVGAGDKSFHFHQASPASVWNIAHNLAKNPAVSVIDSGGTLVIGDVKYLDTNTVQLTFSAGFSGDAWLN